MTTISGDIRKICFVGAGTMGCYNALAAAISGYSVILYDPNEASLEAVPNRQRDMADMLVGAGWCSEKDVLAAAQRTEVTRNLAHACNGVQLVNESVYEDLALKRRVHAELDALCAPSVLLTTNSSALLVSDIEESVKHRERFAALHSHYASPLVDIVPGQSTRPEALAALENYVHSLRGTPLLLKKEHPGYVLNAMLGNVLGAALVMLVDEKYPADVIDASWLSAQEALMGPLGLIDLFGLGVLRDAWMHRNRSDAMQAYQPAVLALLEQKLEAGELGMHSGRGFYAYPDPAYSAPGFTAANRDERCARLQQAALLVQAIALLARGVVDAAQVDLAWTIGMHAPWGPLSLMTELGRAGVMQRIDEAGRAGLLLPEQITEANDWLMANLNDNGELN